MINMMPLMEFALACAVLTALGLPLMRSLAKVWKLERKNFRGDAIPAGFGFLLVIVAVPMYLVMFFMLGIKGATGVFLAAVIGFSGVGLIDDIYGSRDAGGFGGHLGLLRHGKVSTGLIKAVVGGLLAMALAKVAGSHQPIIWLLNGLVIALSANLLNLLDLRPGRAVSCFWACILMLVAVKHGMLLIWSELIPILIPAVALTVLDRSARVMLGDAGSNALGAVVGLALVYSLGLPEKLIVLVLLIGVHAYSEKYSISGLIERNRVLRSLDRLLGER